MHVSNDVQVEKTIPFAHKLKFDIKRKSECYKCLCIGLEEFDPATLVQVALAIPDQDAEKLR